VWQMDRGQFDDQEYVFGASGVAPAYRRSMLHEIGLFDPDFGSYCEDIDLSWRAQLSGYRCVFAPDSVLYHQVSATGGGRLASFFVARNTIWTLAKNVPPQMWRRHKGEIMAGQWQRFLAGLRAWRGPAARATVRGQLAGIVGLPRFLGKRRAIQAMRRVDDTYLESLLIPS